MMLIKELVMGGGFAVTDVNKMGCRTTVMERLEYTKV